MSRTASKGRETKETTIRIELDLDGSGQASCTTGLPFFDHMIENFGKHAGFDLNVFADGDLEVDAHHTVEDVGILLGSAINDALGDKRGIRRFASIRVPLDEAAVECIGQPCADLIRLWLAVRRCAVSLKSNDVGICLDQCLDHELETLGPAVRAAL